MKIRHKILASLFSVLAMLVVVAVFAYSSTMHVDFFRKRSLVLEGQLVALTNLRAQVRNLLLETYEVGFVEGLKGHTDDLKKEKELTQIKFKELEAAIPDTEKRSSVINVLRSEYSEVEKGLDSSIQLTAQGKIGLARAAILDARENKFNKGFIQKITEFIDSQKAEVKESSSGLKQSISQLQNILIVLTALASLLAFGLAFFLSKSIGTRLANLEKATKKISAGDFSVSLPESGSDEVSFLSQAFNSMATSLAWARDELAQQQQFLANSSKMSSLGEMAGGVAHEINNPLAVIKSLSGQVQELIDEEPLDKKPYKNDDGKS
ncbi:MAG: HAMP domain-containing protein [Bdellovibrionota bacterium]